jgi:hypothetical protein
MAVCAKGRKSVNGLAQDQSTHAELRYRPLATSLDMSVRTSLEMRDRRIRALLYEAANVMLIVAFEPLDEPSANEN